MTDLSEEQRLSSLVYNIDRFGDIVPSRYKEEFYLISRKLLVLARGSSDDFYKSLIKHLDEKMEPLRDL